MTNSINLKDIYKSRPFKIRNADEFDQQDVLSLFVDPTTSLKSPVEYENSIIKGRMGTGKTMFLRANYAFCLFELVPRLLNEEELILPIFLKLSDFQHIQNAKDIYHNIILKIIQEMLDVYKHFQDVKKMANIHAGIKQFPYDVFFYDKIKDTAEYLKKLSSKEYVDKISEELGASGELKNNFLKISSTIKETQGNEYKIEKKPSITDIDYIYNLLFEKSEGKLLILIDEASSINKSFYNSVDSDSYFEVFMNQLRTRSFIRTKIAIYPNTFSDILTETRYGDTVYLDKTVSNKNDYISFRKNTETLIENYINIRSNEGMMLNNILIADVFDVENGNFYGDCLEQIINGSNGNLRRLIHLLDATMVISYNNNEGKDRCSISDSIEALNRVCDDNLTKLFSPSERDFLEKTGKVCKARRTFRFKFPNNSTFFYKLISRSNEFSVLTLTEYGAGRKGNIYSFDYSFCVKNNIPTHTYYDKPTNIRKVDPARTIASSGEWISKVTKITNETLLHSEIPDKLEGTIIYLRENKGFIKGEDENEYFFSSDNIIISDKDKYIYRNKRLRFSPLGINDTFVAYDIEVL